MNYEFFIARRLSLKSKGNYTSNISSIAVFTIALSIAVMLVSVSILQGFKNGVKEKIVGFGSHIQVIPYQIDGHYSDNPLSLSNGDILRIKSNKNVKGIAPVLQKSAAVITEGDFQAVLLKGITKDYDTSFFYNSFISGNMPELGRESNQQVIVSGLLADKLNLSLGGKIKVYFYVNDNYRSKKFTVSGIYDTGLGDYDERFLICDASVLQNIFSLSENDYSAYEVNLKNFNLLDQTADEIYEFLPQQANLMTITEMEPNLFSWLNLLDSNVFMILLIMILVCITTLCAIILIMIFEHKKMIGIMKSFGMKNSSVVRIFLYKISYVLVKGLIAGNIIALFVQLIQKYFNVIKLNPGNYYLSSVPIDINLWYIIAINVLVFAVCIVCMLIPAKSINKISVVNNLKFE